MSYTISIKVIPKAKRNEIKKVNEGLKVYLTSPPIEGKANKMLLEFLSEHFNCKKSQIKILKGEKSRNKIIQVKMFDG